MNYKVTFYKDEMEMLTERKANFVNQLKKLSSKITYELFKKIDGNGKGTDKIINFMKSMIERGKSFHTLNLTIPDYINPLIAHLPNTGKEIPIYIIFQKSTSNASNTDLGSIYMEGVCAWTHSKIAGKTLINRIEVTIKFNDKIMDNDMNILRAMFINKFQSTLVHELAHSRDTENAKETAERNTAKSTHDTVTSLHYYLKPTEIRSHLNEVFKSLASSRHVSPKRVIKNYYKNADKAANLEEDPIPFTQDKKDKFRKGYANMVELDNSRPSYDLAVKGLHEIISSSFRTKLPKSQRQFIIDYQIAFSRDFSPKMKERYFDKLFQGYEVPSLEQMNSMFEEVKSVFRGTVRIYNALKKKYYSKNSYYEDKWLRIENLFKEWEDIMWDNPKMTAAMKSNDPKKLKKAAKDTFDLFKSEMGIDKATLNADAARRHPLQRGNIFFR